LKPSKHPQELIAANARDLNPSDELSVFCGSMEPHHRELVDGQRLDVKVDTEIKPDAHAEQETCTIIQREDRLKHLSMLLGILMNIVEQFDTWIAKLVKYVEARELSADEVRMQELQLHGVYNDCCFMTRELLGEMAEAIYAILELSG
jgi:hypothetical protein